jgi:hypothetical protein
MADPEFFNEKLSALCMTWSLNANVISRDMGAEEVNRQLHNMSLGLADSPTEPPAPDRFVKNEE